MGYILGIDFGTTNTTLSYFDENGKWNLIEMPNGRQEMKSVVFCNEDGSFTVGDEALELGSRDPQNLYKFVRSWIGTDFEFEVGDKTLYAKDFLYLILSQAIKKAEQYLGGPEKIEGAVISCPAYYASSAKRDLNEIARRIRLSDGRALEKLYFINDQVAAVIGHYGKGLKKKVIVLDLGETCDVSLVDVDMTGEKKTILVLDVHGDHQHGGICWTDNLRDYLIEQFSDATGIDPSEFYLDRSDLPYFAELAEAMKLELSKAESASVTIQLDGVKHTVSVTRDIFDEITDGKTNYTVFLAEQLLDWEKSKAADIDEILLVGRATQMPCIREKLAKEFGRPVVTDDPGYLVSRGAALYGRMEFDR